jgi:hypothetical protein
VQQSQPEKQPSAPVPSPVAVPSKPSICGEQDPLFPVVFEHFSNELRPNILSRYPTAPPDKVNKVILQKWNTIDPAKKEAFIKKTLRKIEMQKAQLQPKQQ